ncbi:MAG TPA: cytochrome c oxidase assembly protein [Methylomirabilota bacterium]|nr:cytochrome c oxidase assembly protein [Methylomirabilota bacterium]
MSALGVTWRLEVALPLITVTIAYLAGWTQLARRSPARCRPRLIARLALALGGVTAAAIALLALHAAAHESFAVHMIQHLLLIAVAVPALLLADPLPAVLWALPPAVRRIAHAPLVATAGPRRLWEQLTRMPVAWMLHAIALWVWHAPLAYDAALDSPLLHDTEHLVFTLTAVLFWWPVIDPAPRARRAPPLGWRVVYLVLGAFQSAALGVFLVAAPRALYAYGALDDQAMGGVLMWAVGGAVDMAAVLLLVYRFLAAAEKNPSGASLTAPGRQARMSRFEI